MKLNRTTVQGIHDFMAIKIPHKPAARNHHSFRDF